MARTSWLWAAAWAGFALSLAPALAQTAPPDGLGLRPAAPDANADEEPIATLPTLDAAPSADPAASPANPKKRPKAKTGQLPALAAYPRPRRLGLRGPADPVDPPVLAGPAPTVAALPTPPPRRKIKTEDKPFDPVGLYVGNLRLTPYIEEDVGYATNPFGAASGARGSALSTTEVGVAMQSNWSRNELTGAAKLGYNDYVQTPGASSPYGSGVVDYRYDASRDLSFDTEGRYSLTNETNSQLGLAGQSAALTLVSTYGATLGGQNKFGDFTLGLHGAVDREQYDGGSLDTDNYTDYGLKLRGGYRLSEAIQPFVELDGDTRIYDSSIDATGYNRASDGAAAKAGATLALSQLLTGEASFGYGLRDYRDPRLPNVVAPLFDASMIWAMTPLTTVTFKAATQLGDAVVAGASADVNRSYTINVDHALTERIKLGVSGGFATDDYVGIPERDRVYSLGATGEYHLSRELVLKASATHQQLVSNQPGSSYSADTFLLGVRLQR